MAKLTSQSVGTRIGFLGAGRMATALASGFLKSGVVAAGDVFAADVSADALQRMCSETNAQPVGSNPELVEQADVLFLSVKPQHVGTVLREIAPAVTASHLVVSIAAGIPIATLAAALGADKRIIRVMPNTPCLVGAGASAFSPGSQATDADVVLVERLLSTVGYAVPLDESLMDAVTGLSGSGPAYVFQIIEALSDGGVRVGLPRDVATNLAAHTLLGAAKMLLDSGDHPGLLKDAVTSPGGTTIAGLHAMERGGVRAALMNAVEAATLRSAELGRSS